MPLFAIRNPAGLFVASKTTAQGSYTTDLEAALLFPTRTSAQYDASHVSGERVEDVTDYFRMYDAHGGPVR